MSAITIENTIDAPVERVWELWTRPEHIIKWAFASDDWEAPYAENEVRVGGRFKTVMAAKDGSTSFDFAGTYTAVIPHELIVYIIDDRRKVVVKFQPMGVQTKVTETFEPENTNPKDMQRAGWQTILDNFKKYAEGENQKGLSPNSPEVIH